MRFSEAAIDAVFLLERHGGYDSDENPTKRGQGYSTAGMSA
ncbi:MAG TPA: hypothetical protein PLG17_04330 [Thermodesulfobacteriota bacterium]|nr:hypothetical protein [Thermodesulfobacteriota bacterium]